MNSVQFNLILSAISVLMCDRLQPIFRESYSWWLVPVMLLGFFIALVLLQAIIFVLSIVLLGNDKKSPLSEKFFRLQVKEALPILLFLARVKVDTTGSKELEIAEKALFVCNHQHDFDPIIIYNAFPDMELSFIGKKDILTEMGFVAKAMKLLSCFFIDRENDREAAKTIINATRRLKEQKNSIGLFPEGYCSKTEELLPLRNGSLRIALKSKTPIAVCVINNTRQVPKRMFRKKTVVNFRLIDVITPDIYENMTTAELGDLIHGKMEVALREIKTKG